MEIPSKPRNDNTATAAAPNAIFQVKVCGSYNGDQLQCPLPAQIAHPPTTMKTSNTSSSPTSISQVNLAVSLIPRELMTVFTTTNATSHTHTGTIDTVACMATAATRYSNVGTKM